MREEYIQAFTTVDEKENAERIANTLLDRRLAACVQVLGPLQSVYRWKGKIENKKEWLLVVKTEDRFYARIEKTIKSLHSYQVPEIIALPIEKGNAEYLEWLNEQLL